MNADWKRFLASKGAQFTEHNTVADFGNAHDALAAARQQTVVADLSQFGLLQVCGDDAQTFLNNLLSSDVKNVQPGQCQYSTLSTPKGRMLASMLICRRDSDFLVQLPASQLEAIKRRLSMYILRSKVQISAVDADSVLLGVAGPGAEAALERCFARLPSQPLTAMSQDAAFIVRLTDTMFQIHLTWQDACSLFEQLAKNQQPVGEPVWRWLALQNGFAWIYPATQEQFVPQMANMDALGAVSFSKGCYPGQEIVARTQYLGKLKRRMYLTHVDVEPTSAIAGTELYSPELPGQAIGMIADSAPSPDGGIDALAVVQTSCWEHGITLGAADGPSLVEKPLPYHLT